MTCFEVQENTKVEVSEFSPTSLGTLLQDQKTKTNKDDDQQIQQTIGKVGLLSLKIKEQDEKVSKEIDDLFGFDWNTQAKWNQWMNTQQFVDRYDRKVSESSVLDKLGGRIFTKC